MAALHPNQHVYFNALTDTKTAGAPGNRYHMDYSRLAQWQSLEYLLARYPEDALRVWPKRNWSLQHLSQEDRDRVISLESPHAADFYLLDSSAKGCSGAHPLLRNNRCAAGFRLHPRIEFQRISEPPIHSIRAYGSVIASIYARGERHVDAYRAAYADVAANGTLLARSVFDIYAYDGALYYLNANCALSMSNDADSWVFLHIIPSDPADMPSDRRELGFVNGGFRLSSHAALFDNKCFSRMRLPDYSIARIRTGQDAAASGGGDWRVDINLAAHAAAQAAYDSIAAGDYGKPIAQSRFDLYLTGNSLAYLKEPCVPADADARFFLHIFPADPADLPAAWREFGFVNLDFQFADRGARIDDRCVAERELLGYAIECVRTGQFVSGEGRLWGVEFPVGR